MHCNELWSVKKFQNKLELDKYLEANCYILTANASRFISCRFCLAENPNESTHMVQAYLICQKCAKKQNETDEKFCTKTNICFVLKRYELLTNHSEVSIDSSDSANSPINIDLFDSNITFGNLRDIKDRYYQTKELFTWNVKNIFPNQSSLFTERYILKINDKWFEFQNGKEKHIFKVEEENFNEIKLLRDDFKLFRLDSNCFFNITENKRECEGKWIIDLNSKIPCIPCSREFNRMVFDCDIHLEANFYEEKSKITQTQTQTNKVWQANEKNDKKYFKRKDFETWEEYCNDKLTDTFKFIGFSENNDIIIRRNSKIHPDYLRFTENELFIGKFKDFIYTPVYSGSWSN